MNTARGVLLVLGMFTFSSTVFSQATKELSPGYYIVVSAYGKSQEKMAKNYADVLKGKGLQAEYGFNASRGFYFVYLKYFNNLRESLQDMKSTRQAGTFTDAWVRVVTGDIPIAEISTESSTAQRTPPSSHLTEERREEPIAIQEDKEPD